MINVTFTKTLLALSIGALVACGGGGSSDPKAVTVAKTPAAPTSTVATSTPTTTATTAPDTTATSTVTTTAAVPVVVEPARSEWFENPVIVPIPTDLVAGMCAPLDSPEGGWHTGGTIYLQDFNEDGIMDMIPGIACGGKADETRPGVGRIIPFLSTADGTWVPGGNEVFGVDYIETTGFVHFTPTMPQKDMNGDGYIDPIGVIQPEDGRYDFSTQVGASFIMTSLGGSAYDYLEYAPHNFVVYAWHMGETNEGKHRIWSSSFGSTSIGQENWNGDMGSNFDDFDGVSITNKDAWASQENNLLDTFDQMADSSLIIVGEHKTYMFGYAITGSQPTDYRADGLFVYDRAADTIELTSYYRNDEPVDGCSVNRYVWNGEPEVVGVTRMPSGRELVSTDVKVTLHIPAGSINNPYDIVGFRYNGVEVPGGCDGYDGSVIDSWEHGITLFEFYEVVDDKLVLIDGEYIMPTAMDYLNDKRGKSDSNEFYHVDVNGDGLVDMVSMTTGNIVSGPGKPLVLINTGNEYVVMDLENNLDLNKLFDVPEMLVSKAFLQDVNNDGILDLVTVGAPGSTSSVEHGVYLYAVAYGKKPLNLPLVK